MAQGDLNDFLGRLRAALPTKWFPDIAPVLDGLLAGLASAWATAWSNLQFLRAQTRLKTAVGEWLDMAALDFTGGRLVRRPGEPDAAFSIRLRREIMRPRAIRAAMVQVLTDLTGRVPRIVEPGRVTDTGGYAGAGVSGGTGAGYGVAGAWGSRALPFQAFVTAYRGVGGGVPNVAGYYQGTGWLGGGYGVGAIEWTTPAMSLGQVTDADIYAAAASVLPEAGTAWLAISN